MSWVLGIDLGTSSLRAYLLNTADGSRKVAQVEYDFAIPQQNWAEQDPEDWWQAFLNALAQLRAEADVDLAQVEAISFSGQMHGLVLLDEEHQAVRPAILWNDQRSKDLVEQFETPEWHKFFAENTCNKLHTGFALASFLWLKEHEEAILAKAKVFLSPKDYLRFRICGELGAEQTDAAATLLFDVENAEWSNTILDEFALPREIFPQLNLPADLAGYVLAEVAQETGLSTDCKVFYGAADQTMQMLGNGVVKPGDVSVAIGTGGQVLTVLAEPKYHPSLATHTFNYIEEDSYFVMGATLAAGLSLKWLRNLLAEDNYDVINREAEQVGPGAGGVIFLPYLGGERTPHADPNAKGVFFGLSLAHGRGNFYRSVMEGVAFSLRDCLELITDLGVKPAHVIATGGGANSELWLQIIADVLNIEVHRSESSEQSALGAAIVAAVGNGNFTSYEEACQALIKPSAYIVKPNADLIELYDKQYKKYQELYQLTKTIM